MEVYVKYKGKLLKRKITPVPFGNHVMNIVRVNGWEYLIGDGDEYMRGYGKVYSLGRRLRRYR